MSLAEGDRVVNMMSLHPGDSVLTVCENGFGKRTPIEEYRLTRRGAKGVINIKTTERNGDVVAVRSVNDDDELMMITTGGIMLRTDLTAVRVIGRNTQGIRLIRVDEGDKVVAVAKLAKDDSPTNGSKPAEPEASASPEAELQDKAGDTPDNPPNNEPVE